MAEQHNNAHDVLVISSVFVSSSQLYVTLTELDRRGSVTQP